MTSILGRGALRAGGHRRVAADVVGVTMSNWAIFLTFLTSLSIILWLIADVAQWSAASQAADAAASYYDSALLAQTGLSGGLVQTAGSATVTLPSGASGATGAAASAACTVVCRWVQSNQLSIAISGTQSGPVTVSLQGNFRFLALPLAPGIYPSTGVGVAWWGGL